MSPSCTDDTSVHPPPAWTPNHIIINAIFKIDDTQLPSFSGLYDSNGEYVIVKLNKVVTENIEDNDSIDTYYNDYIALIESEVEAAYILNLRVNADIEINDSIFANR